MHEKKIMLRPDKPVIYVHVCTSALYAKVYVHFSSAFFAFVKPDINVRNVVANNKNNHWELYTGIMI